jgi:hypothetical protein
MGEKMCAFYRLGTDPSRHFDEYFDALYRPVNPE